MDTSMEERGMDLNANDMSQIQFSVCVSQSVSV